MGAVIAGCGKALPALRVQNDDLARIVDTSDDWIVKRTGIHERRIALDESATDLASAACASVLGMDMEIPKGVETAAWHGFGKDPRSPSAHSSIIDPDSIDLLVCMTVSGDAIIPSQAALVKMRLGLSNAVAFDLNAACSGCVYGLAVAEGMMQAAAAHPTSRQSTRRALVVGVERLSHVTDWTDRATCVLFGDGAGAVLLEWRDDASGILSTFLKNTDDVDLTLSLGPLRRCNIPFDADGVSPDGFPEAHKLPVDMIDFIGMKGREVFKFATAAVKEAIEAAASRAGLGIADIDRIVPHQANERILSHVAKKMGFSLDRFQITIGEYGNTSSASALITLCDALCSGDIHPGDRVVMVGFGGGLTSGAILFEA